MTMETLAPAWGEYFGSLVDEEKVGKEWTEQDELVVRAAELEAERSPQTVLRVPLHIGQIVALRAKEQHIFVIAGTGGGKTIFAPRWLYREIERFQHEPVNTQTYLVCAPSYKILKRATLPAYVRFFH